MPQAAVHGTGGFRCSSDVTWSENRVDHGAFLTAAGGWHVLDRGTCTRPRHRLPCPAGGQRNANARSPNSGLSGNFDLSDCHDCGRLNPRAR